MKASFGIAQNFTVTIKLKTQKYYYYNLFFFLHYDMVNLRIRVGKPKVLSVNGQELVCLLQLVLYLCFLVF